MKDVDVIQRVNIGSDHQLVRGTIKINTRLDRSKTKKSGKPKLASRGFY